MTVQNGFEMTKAKGFSLLELLIVVAIILIIATIAIPSMLRSRQAANESHAVANLRTLNTAEVQYISTFQVYGELADLVTTGLLDQRYSAGSSGYEYDVELSGDSLDYTALAEAQSANSGRYDYYTRPDYIIRYSDDALRAPTGMSGTPVR
jgi:prepilin-type N-terminal cleavage/methylation domain-containing protein